LCEAEHARAFGHDLLLDLRAAERRTRRLAQRDVQHGAALGGVDELATKHGVDTLAQARDVGQLAKLRQRNLIEPLAREIHQQSDLLAREALEAPRVALEELRHRHDDEPRGLRGELGPHRCEGTGIDGECHQPSPCAEPARRQCHAQASAAWACQSR